MTRHRTATDRVWILWIVWTTYHAPYFLGTPVYDPPDTASYERIADILVGKEPFPDEPFYFPPGYSFVLALLRSLFGSSAPWAVTVIQHVAILAMGLMLFDVARRRGYPRIGFAAGLLVTLNPALLFWTHVMYTEILTSFALVSILWCLQRTTDAPRYQIGWLVGASGFICWAGLMRQVPYLLAIPAGLYAQALYRNRGAVARVTVLLLPMSIALATFASWSAFVWRQCDHFQHTSGGGRHLYNRVVFTDRTIARDGAATRRLLATVSETEALQPHWDVYELLRARGFSSEDANDLMTRVGLESVMDRPLKYAFGTGQLFLRYWFVEPDRLTESVRCAAILPRLGELLKPIVTLLVYCTGQQVVGALALVAAACAVFAGPSFLRLTVALVALYLLPHAAGEWASLRFGIPIYPLTAFLAPWGVLVAGRWLALGEPDRDADLFRQV